MPFKLKIPVHILFPSVSNTYCSYLLYYCYKLLSYPKQYLKISCGYVRIAAGLYCLLILEHPCAIRIHRVIYRIWGSCAYAHDIMMCISMMSFIDAMVNNVMFGQVFSILKQSPPLKCHVFMTKFKTNYTMQTPENKPQIKIYTSIFIYNTRNFNKS